MIAFAKRNIQVFFRDRASVFFSVLSVILIIGLYVLFLGDSMLTQFPGLPGARFLMDSWIMAGLLAVTSVTTTLGATGTVIDDRHRGIAKDFHASPLTKTAIVGGYLFSVIAVGLIMGVITFVLAEVYIVTRGGSLLPWPSATLAGGIMVLSVLAGSSMVFCGATFFKTHNAFGVASTVLGTLIGFLTGIYIPIGALPGSVQTAIKLFPISHSAALLRQIFMQAPAQIVFAGAPPEVALEFKTQFGVVYELGAQQISTTTHIFVLLLTAIICFILGVWRMLHGRAD